MGQGDLLFEQHFEAAMENAFATVEQNELDDLFNELIENNPPTTSAQQAETLAIDEGDVDFNNVDFDLHSAFLASALGAIHDLDSVNASSLSSGPASADGILNFPAQEDDVGALAMVSSAIQNEISVTSKEGTRATVRRSATPTSSISVGFAQTFSIPTLPDIRGAHAVQDNQGPSESCTPFIVTVAPSLEGPLLRSNISLNSPGDELPGRTAGKSTRSPTNEPCYLPSWLRQVLN